MKGKNERRKGSPYPELFRIRVAKEYLAGGVSRKELATKYCVDPTLVSHWVTIFVRRTKQYAVMDKKIRRSSPVSTDREKALEREVLELKKALRAKEKELERSDLQVFALDTMIDVAEEMFDIEIRKKPGAKQ